MSKMYFVRCRRQLHACRGETTIHTGHMREFVDFMTGQGLQSAPRLSTVRFWRRPRIPCGLEFIGEPFDIHSVQGPRGSDT